MILQLLPLLCFRLCVGQNDTSRGGSLPRPSLSAWPSSVVPAGSNVTLRCRAPTSDVYLVLRKGEIVFDFATSSGSRESLAEFQLAGLTQGQAGEYTCEYSRMAAPFVSSPHSDALLLLVTGRLSKPSLGVRGTHLVSTTENVTLHCHLLNNSLVPVVFLLLKAGVSSPLQLRGPAEKGADFVLQAVRDRDAGNYSCVYYQTQTPFWASEPSDPLEILVTGLLVGQRENERDGSLPRPSLSAWPSSVVPAGSNVTLRCRAPTSDVYLVLRKGEIIFDFATSSGSRESLAEFQLAGLTSAEAGEYTCHYSRVAAPHRASPRSDALLLLVTGLSQKPSLHVLQRRRVPAGESVTLQCRRAAAPSQYDTCALLKAGTPAPVQQRSSGQDRVLFSLQGAAAAVAGNYSCVFHQAGPPFGASEPSDRLEILVTGPLSGDYATGNLIRLAAAALTVVIMGAFLVEACVAGRRLRVNPARPAPQGDAE